MKRITVFVGHYGSGKTELAVNYAIKLSNLGKKVLIVDDVISTGESLSSIRDLLVKAEGIEAAACAVLAEGDAADRTDIIFLEKLPLFFK